jgi:hypothetical protein
MSWTVPFPEASELTKLETKHLDHVGGSDEEDEELLKEENRVAAKYTVVANKNRNVTPLGKSYGICFFTSFEVLTTNVKMVIILCALVA